MKQQNASKNLFYLLTAGLTLFCSEVSANASAKDVHDIADICMYSQHNLKNYALVGMGVTCHDPKKDLEDDIETVDKYFGDLKSHKLNDKLMAEVTEVEKSWSALKPEFEKAPDKTKMSELRKKVEAYTVRCEQIIEDLAKDTGIKGEHYVVLVAKLGLESQRMAALYQMKVWGVADANYEQQVTQVIDETEKIYQKLLTTEDKLVSKEIKEKLKSTENDFIAFGVMAKSTSGRFMPMRTEKSANNIFDALHEILKMEETLVQGTVSEYFLPVADLM